MTKENGFIGYWKVTQIFENSYEKDVIEYEDKWLNTRSFFKENIINWISIWFSVIFQLEFKQLFIDQNQEDGTRKTGNLIWHFADNAGSELSPLLDCSIFKVCQLKTYYYTI